ncbi:putative ABC transporter permease YtrC [Bacillus rhizoplanae]|uniref:ABC transporter permease YtrC n=1 Tax=Bacillus rhizoplanae TaxID=2880966 RepID=A0ABN7ZUD9_9BACI|nr:ABC-2 transporter permease [Bacillus rhizoplanae]CAG9610907.1 putative ABC transporter permease YtrC [Bacillus rhizoplanae]
MFHKALWMRTYKQGKYIVLLFWLSSLYLLPYQYYSDAQAQLRQSKMKFDDYIYYYSYSFSGPDIVIVQGILLIALACILIGWERNNQSTDFLWSMPFQRKSIFLTKWLFGIFNIIIVNFICWISMYGIKKVSFHNAYQDFSPFHTYFIYATISLIAIYTFALFIGTITGNLFSQGALTAVILFLPYGLALLLSGFLSAHIGDSKEELYKMENKLGTYLAPTSIVAPLDTFYIQYDYHPQMEFDRYGNKISESPTVNPMKHTSIPSAWKLFSPFIYIVLFLPIAIVLYMRSPNEQNGKILLFPQLQKWFIGCTVLCFALLGGQTLGANVLWSYYIAFLGTGIVSYIILTRLLKWNFSFSGR